MNHALNNLYRCVSNLDIEIPESLSKQLDKAVHDYVTSTTEPVDLTHVCRCVRCGVPTPWEDQHLATVLINGTYRIVRHVCSACASTCPPPPR